MSRPTRIFVTFLVPVLALALGWQLGVRATSVRFLAAQDRLEEMLVGHSQSGVTIEDPKDDVNIEILWTTWRLLLSNYLRPEELNVQKMVEGAVTGMVASIGDPYTLFMTKEENTDFQESLSGNLEGIGAELSLEEGVVRIVRLIEGSPAERSGLLPEDVITLVDGEDMSNKTLFEVISVIRGPKGTPVKLSVMRETSKAQELKEFTITRDTIHIPSSEYEEKTATGGTVGLLTISQFGTETIPEVEEILKKIDPTKIKGLIIDLRYNGGGYLDGAIDLTSMFQKEGRVVTVASRNDEDFYDVSGKTILPTIPLVILMNEGSASASEIVAGALQDHGRATIIGTQSFGKGTVQEVIELPGGASLRVTTATWLTPKGTDLGKHGVTPNIVIERTPEDLTAKRDPQLERALKKLAP